MRIAVGSDHAGLQLRRTIVAHLRQAGHEVTDLGPDGSDSVDYPLYAERVAQAVVQDGATLGILVCGTGLGVSIAANKVRGSRAALCTDEFTARMARSHNDANVLCLGQRVVGDGVALSVVDAFVAGTFAGGRHARRVEQVCALEDKNR